MYKYYLIITNKVKLKKSIEYMKKNIIDGEDIVSPRPLPKQNVVSNIIYTKVKIDSNNYKKTISFNQCIELTEDEYNDKTKLIKYKW